MLYWIAAVLLILVQSSLLATPQQIYWNRDHLYLGREGKPIVVTAEPATSTGLGLVIPIEMGAGLYGISLSSQSGPVIDERTSVMVNVDDYDNATYLFEIVASNTDSVNRSIELIDSSNVSIAAVTLSPGDTLPIRKRSGSFMLTGAKVYRVRLPQTTANNQVRIENARIVITQTNASRTAVQIPLFSSFSQTSGTTYNYGTDSDHFNLWRFRQSSYGGTITGYRFDAVLSDNYFGEKFAYAALHDVTTNTVVPGAEVKTKLTEPTYATTEFGTSLVDDHLYDVRFRHEQGSGSAFLYVANLYIKISQLRKAEIYWRLARTSFSLFSVTDPCCRALLSLSGYSTPTNAYFEATAREYTNGDVSLHIRQNQTNDFGDAVGINVSGSKIEYPNATRQLIRTPNIIGSLVDGHRYTFQIDRFSGQVRGAGAFLVISAGN